MRTPGFEDYGSIRLYSMRILFIFYFFLVNYREKNLEGQVFCFFLDIVYLGILEVGKDGLLFEFGGVMGSGMG